MEWQLIITDSNRIQLSLKESSKVEELYIISIDTKEECLRIKAEDKIEITFMETNKVKELEVISIHTKEIDNTLRKNLTYSMMRK